MAASNDIDTKNTNLRKNMQYAIDLVNNDPGKYNLFDLIKATRFKHNQKKPLNLKAARDAVFAATLDEKIYMTPILDHNIYHKNNKFYPPHCKTPGYFFNVQ
mgnify:FL=1